MIIGVRHGEVHNPGNVLYGHLPGFGLSDLGHKQAGAVADALRGANVHAVYSSPLQRAVETATPIAQAAGVQVQVDERLFEWRFFSPWAGMTWDEVRREAGPRWDEYLNSPALLEGTESLAVCAARLESWVDEHRADEGITVGISHMDPLKAVALKLAGRPMDHLWQIEVSHCTAVVLDPDPDAAGLDAAALAAHVGALRGN